MAHGLSCSTACGTSPDQGLNSCAHTGRWVFVPCMPLRKSPCISFNSWASQPAPRSVVSASPCRGPAWPSPIFPTAPQHPHSQAAWPVWGWPPLSPSLLLPPSPPPLSTRTFGPRGLFGGGLSQGGLCGGDLSGGGLSGGDLSGGGLFGVTCLGVICLGVTCLGVTPSRPCPLTGL